VSCHTMETVFEKLGGSLEKKSFLPRKTWAEKRSQVEKLDRTGLTVTRRGSNLDMLGAWPAVSRQIPRYRPPRGSGERRRENDLEAMGAPFEGKKARPLPS